MAPFYNLGDQNIYNSGQYFIPQEKYRLNYNAPIVEEEEETSSMGIPYTSSFTNFSNRDNNSFNTGNLQPYKAQPSGSFVTNRTDYGSSGYLPGTEPEETYMDKIGGLIKTGIGMAIPGGNFLMSIGDKLNRFDNLSAQDQAFIEMQKGIDERSIHGFGNLPNQDRYGYNKVSMLGNYANVVAERVQKAKDFFEKKGYYRPIDKYYLEKAKEQDDIKNQIDFNNFIRQRTAANKIREAQKKGIKLGPTGVDIHGSPTPPDGGDGTYGVGADNQKSYDFGQGFGVSATTGGPVSNRTGRGRTDYMNGGIVSL